jgi:hypothetical protein
MEMSRSAGNQVLGLSLLLQAGALSLYQVLKHQISNPAQLYDRIDTLDEFQFVFCQQIRHQSWFWI